MGHRIQTLRTLSVQLAARPSLLTTLPHDILRSHSLEDGPWWNARAVTYLEEHLPPGGSAFEWGSGASTVWLASQGLHVIAIEADAEWAARVRRRCPEVEVRLIPGATSGRLRSEPQLRDRGQHFFDEYVATIDRVDSAGFDVVVVDGICRTACAQRAAERVKPGGLVVLDDTNFDFLRPAAEPFSGWETVRLSGFKRRSVIIYETTFFWRPA